MVVIVMVVADQGLSLACTSSRVPWMQWKCSPERGQRCLPHALKVIGMIPQGIAIEILIYIYYIYIYIYYMYCIWVEKF